MATTAVTEAAASSIVTWEHGKCYVHEVIANVERGRHECPPVIAAIGS